MVGSNVPLTDESPLPDQRLAAATLSGANIAAPDGALGLLHPKAALDRSARLHVVWAESDSIPRTGDAWAFADRRSLWYAVFDGKRWTRATRLLQGRKLHWGEGYGDVAIDGGDRLHVVVGGIGETGFPVFLHARKDGRGWRIGEVARAQAWYTSLAVRDDDLYLAYIGADSADAGENRVMLARSADGGVSWSRPIPARRAGRANPTDLTALVGRDGMLHLVWAESAPGRLTPEVVLHVASSDQGASWTEPSTAVLPKEVVGLRGAVDGCGALHFVYQAMKSAEVPTPGFFSSEFGYLRSEIGYLRWAGGWTEPTSLFSEYEVSTDAVVFAGPGGRIHLVWSAGKVRGGSEPRFLPMVSTLNPSR
jgi:hypothetical protein